MVTVLPPVEVVPGVWALERFDSTGWGWTVVVVALPGGGTLIYSPAWLDDRTLERVAEHGEPRILCAPNAYHHRTLERFRERWPKAVAVASERAMPRLLRQGHPRLRPVNEVLGQLPPHAQWHHPQGTKTGEVWLSLPHPTGTTLLVADAFFNINRPTTGLVGFALRRLRVVPGLRVSTTYRLLAVADVASYCSSCLALLQAIRPTEVVFSHGEFIRGADCGPRLLSALENRWPQRRKQRLA